MGLENVVNLLNCSDLLHGWCHDPKQ
jgi:hypothetical protein